MSSRRFRETDRRLSCVTVLVGARGGRHPDGNSLLVVGGEETAILDLSLSVRARYESMAPVDRVLVSHAHEDHMAAADLCIGLPLHVHELDAPAFHSLDVLLDGYGLDDAPAVKEAVREMLLHDFHYTARPDVLTLRDGDVLDLGGGVRITVLHAPGHTRGHCVFHIAPDDVLYLADIDLSGFGPYYGDAVSCLEDFERTLRMVRQISARWYATFHHVGLMEGRETFVERLDRYEARIAIRERRLLDFLHVPRTISEVIAHRFVYRPRDRILWADAAERRSMTQHLDRLVATGRVREVGPGQFLAAAPT